MKKEAMKKEMIRASTIWLGDYRARIEVHKRGPFFTVTHNFQVHDPHSDTQTFWHLTYNGANRRYLELFLAVKAERDARLGY